MPEPYFIMEYEVKIHPLNAKGKYYVDQDTCTCSDTCTYHAPDNFTYRLDEKNFGYYVAKQPENAEEEAKCKEALNSCPVEAIHDDGETNSEIQFISN